MEGRTVKTYDFQTAQGLEGPGYQWTGRQGSMLKVPDASWDVIVEDESGRQLWKFFDAE